MLACLYSVKSFCSPVDSTALNRANQTETYSLWEGKEVGLLSAKAALVRTCTEEISRVIPVVVQVDED